MRLMATRASRVEDAATMPGAARRAALRWRTLAAFALLVFATVLVYSPALHGGLLWDDAGFVTAPNARSLPGLYRIWLDYIHAASVHYPLLHSFFWIESRLWDDQQLGYHLANLLLHLTAAGLVYLNLRKLQIPGAALAAAVFALHPLQVESAAWISEQKNTLSAVFYLGALLVYLRFDETRKASLYALALGLFGMALLSKTVTATLPAGILVIFWWKRGTVSWRRDVLPLVPFLVVGAAAGSFTAWVEQNVFGAEGEPYDLSLVQRGLLAGRVIWFYVGKLVWPANLIFMYPRWQVDASVWWQWLFPLAALSVLIALWLVRGRWRAPLAAWLFFVGTLFPALGFFNVYPFRYSFVADHFQYLAGLGLIVPAAAALAMARARLPRRVQPLGSVAGVVLLGTLGVLTWRQSHMYANIETLWRTTIDRNPGCWMAYNNLGTVLQRSQRIPEAIALYEQALRIKPNHGPAHNNLGAALLATQRPGEAIEQFQQALSLMPGDADTHNNLGAALFRAGRFDEAIEQYQEGIRLKPSYAKAYANLAFAYAATGRSDEAIATAQKCLEMAQSQGQTGLAQYVEGWLSSYRARQASAPAN
jgi:tetratricopeptide (TPR) repeat protein